MSKERRNSSGEPPGKLVSSKLAFLEALFGCARRSEVARLGADWIMRRTRARHVVVALVEDGADGRARLVGRSTRGSGASLLPSLSVDLDDRGHPLVRALRAPRSIALPAKTRDAIGLPPDGERYAAHALRSPGHAAGIGVVVVGVESPVPKRTGTEKATPSRDVRWALAMLGRRLEELGPHRGAPLAERGRSVEAKRSPDVAPREAPRSAEGIEESYGRLQLELVQQNERLQRQAVELEAASAAKSQFLANMSHEFRTPLNAILGYTSMMLQGVSGPFSPHVVRQLGRIDSNGKHLLTIIDDVLDIARIEAGKVPLERSSFSPAELVEEVLAELAPLVTRSKLSVSTEIGEGVPPLRTDRAKTKQIVMNLVSNAIKFTPSGSVVVSVSVGAPADGAKAARVTSIAVTDTGIGIAEADRSRVFEAFRQVDNSSTRPYGGTGLGLAICRRLAHALGGDIRLESEVGRGSTFTLVMPRRPLRNVRRRRASKAKGLAR